MESALICSTLRRRPDWTGLLTALQQANTAWRWKEARLETHDIAIPMPTPGQSSRSVFRAILLTPDDVGTDQTRSRVERLHNLNGGQYVAVVLLMKKPVQGKENATSVLMKLQLELVGGLEMPIIPVVSAATVPTSLSAFHRQLCTSEALRKRTSTARSILPYCATMQVLPEHAVNVLSDITTSMGDLADKASTEAGHQQLVEFLGDAGEQVIRFWTEDHLIE